MPVPSLKRFSLSNFFLGLNFHTAFEDKGRKRNIGRLIMKYVSCLPFCLIVVKPLKSLLTFLQLRAIRLGSFPLLWRNGAARRHLLE